MAIIINPELISVPVTLAVDAHHGLLRDELASKVGAHVKGVSAMEHGKHYAHVQTTVSDETAKAIIEALIPHLAHLTNEYRNATVLDEMRAQYGSPVVDILASGKADSVIIDNRIIRHPDYPAKLSKIDPLSPELDDTAFAALQRANDEYPRQTMAFDIRVRILADLQRQFPQVTNLAFMRGDAIVTVRGDVPDGTHEQIAAVVAKHDPSKAPKPPETLEEKVARLEKQVDRLMHT